jgi:hypothetical protein
VLLFELGEEDTKNWCLLGGQMMYLLAAEAGRTLARPTADMDVVIDVRESPGSTEWLAHWLDHRNFDIAPSPEGVGHRFLGEAQGGKGHIVFDVLGPERLR